jgi:hypothetical protein
MDLLSLVGIATRQRETYFKQAERLAKKFPELSQLEERMSIEAKVIVKGLRDQQMKFDEYERTLVDKTLISALTAVYLGAGESQPKEKMKESFSGIVGNMLPYLSTFMDETIDYIDSGVLKYNDDSVDFAEDPDNNLTIVSSALEANTQLDPDYPAEWMDTSPEEQAAIETATKKAQGRTWKSVLNRVVRYIANPAYSFFQLGVFLKEKQQGSKEMRRIAILDGRVCVDCKNYDAAGWQPIGSLPMPGKGCRCCDNCRCRIEYR